MATNEARFQEALENVLCARIPGVKGIARLQQLSAGASMETWSFDAVGDTSVLALILRRRPPANSRPDDVAALGKEAAAISAAAGAGVPVPFVRYVLREEDRLG